MKRELLFIGIDPGRQGAIAIIDREQNVRLLEDWPGDEIAAARNFKAFLLKQPISTNYKAAIEKVHAIFKVTARTNFVLGTNYGIWKMALAMAGISFQEVAPVKWQKGVIHKAQDTKEEASVAAASRVFPRVADQLRGPRGGKKDGRADALLIADWARRSFK